MLEAEPSSSGATLRVDDRRRAPQVVAGLVTRQVDVFGYQLGALLAAELAISRPQQIRRVMLWGVPSYAAQDRVSLLQNSTALGSREDGSDVVEEWQRALSRRGPGAPIATVADEFGSEFYGTIAGTLAVPATIARALGPVTYASLVAITGGHAPVLLLGTAVFVIAALLVRMPRAGTARPFVPITVSTVESRPL